MMPAIIAVVITTPVPITALTQAGKPLLLLLTGTTGVPLATSVSYVPSYLNPSTAKDI